MVSSIYTVGMKPHELLATVETNLEKTSGIYMILCVAANKAYIGQSKNIHRRWIHHKHCLNNKKHGNPYLQRLYDKYGKDSFFFVVLENRKDDLSNREAYFVSQLDEETKLNLAPIEELIPISEETRKKLSERRKGWVYSEETKQRMKEACKGRIPPSRKGKKWSEESKQRLKEKRGK